MKLNHKLQKILDFPFYFEFLEMHCLLLVLKVSHLFSEQRKQLGNVIHNHLYYQVLKLFCLFVFPFLLLSFFFFMISTISEATKSLSPSVPPILFCPVFSQLQSLWKPSSKGECRGEKMAMTACRTARTLRQMC